MVKFKNSVRKTLGATAILGLALTGYTAHAADWTPAAAPITYKGSNPYAGGYIPTPQVQAPQYATPQYRPQAALPMPTQPAPYTQVAPAPFNPNAIDRTLYTHQKVGKPYTIAGRTYYPQHDPSYDRVGTASWYGDKFHGKPTANGEIYDKNALTAAHPTLPLNSYVYITNMQTGQVLKVRLNDRGPFIDNRIIDLSEAAATALGIRNGGLAQVRVQYAGPSAPGGQEQAYRAPTPRLTAQAPVMPAPRYVAPQVPQPVMPTPRIQQPQAQQPPVKQLTAPVPNYQPLRRQAQPLGNVAELPRAPQALPLAPRSNIPPLNASPGNLGLELPSAPIAIPQAMAPSDDDSIVTLTIKGPIHMANDKDTNKQARLIKTVNRVSYKTK